MLTGIDVGCMGTNRTILGNKHVRLEHAYTKSIQGRDIVVVRIQSLIAKNRSYSTLVELEQINVRESDKLRIDIGYLRTPALDP